VTQQRQDPKGRDQEGTKRQNCYCLGARPVHPKSECPGKDAVCHKCGRKRAITKSAARAKQLKQADLVSQDRLKYIACRHNQGPVLASLQSNTHLQTIIHYQNLTSSN